MLVRVRFTSDKTCNISLPFNPASGVVRVSTSRGEWHLGWNGQVTPDQLCIGRIFGQSLALEEFVRVTEVTPVRLKHIEVEPFDENCWELIEHNCEYLEMHILQQIKVVQAGLVFPIWVQEGLVWLKASNFPEQWGVLSRDSELAVKPKPREVREAKTLFRNAPLSEALITKDFPGGSLLACRTDDGCLRLGVATAGEVRTNHISWTALEAFAMVEVFPVFPVKDNQPTLIHKFTREVKQGAFKLAVTGPRLPDCRTVLQDGCSLHDLSVEVTGTTVNLQEWVPYMIFNPDQDGWSQWVEFTEALPSSCIPNLHVMTDSFNESIEQLVYTNLNPYFTQALPDYFYLLQGPTGSGKTVFIHFLKAELCLNYIATEVIHCKTLSTKDNSHLLEIVDAAKRAKKKAPTLLVLEDLDEICPQTEEVAVGMGADYSLNSLRVAITVLSALEGASNVRLLVTCTHESRLNKLLLTGHEWKVLDVPVWSFKDTCGVLQQLLPSQISVGPVAANMKAFQPIDVFTFTRQINLKLPAMSEELTDDTLLRELEAFVPQSLEQKPKETMWQWEDIGGLREAKKKMEDMLRMPVKFALLYKHYELKQRSGILLYGPPGCGKTILGQAIPSLAHLSFLYVKGPELLNKYIGASEQAVRDLFAKAKKAAPSVVFIDEFEAIGTKRGNNNAGVTDRTVNQFLCELDGVETRGSVYVVAATSRPEMVDAALLRPGRLDLHVHVDFPSADDREDICQKLLQKLGIHIDVRGIGQVTEHFTGADIKGLINKVQINLANHVVEKLDYDTLYREAQATAASLSEKQIEMYKRQYYNFQHGVSDTVGTKLTLR